MLITQGFGDSYIITQGFGSSKGANRFSELDNISTLGILHDEFDSRTTIGWQWTLTTYTPPTGGVIHELDSRTIWGVLHDNLDGRSTLGWFWKSPANIYIFRAKDNFQITRVYPYRQNVVVDRGI